MNDEVSEAEVETAAKAMRSAFVGYSVLLTKMDGDECTYTASMKGFKPKEFDEYEEASKWIGHEHDKLVVKAALTATAQARASAAETEIAALRGVMARLQWCGTTETADGGYEACCPICEWPEAQGQHAPDCVLARALPATEPQS